MRGGSPAGAFSIRSRTAAPSWVPRLKVGIVVVAR